MATTAEVCRERTAETVAVELTRNELRRMLMHACADRERSDRAGLEMQCDAGEAVDYTLPDKLLAAWREFPEEDGR